ncbi:hypothetical protein [Azospirillum argentinense]
MSDTNTDRIVANHPVTTEGNITIVHHDDWDGELFRLPWMATNDQIAAVITLAKEAKESGYSSGKQAGRNALAHDMRKLLGWPSQYEMDQAHARLDRLENGSSQNL